MTLNTNHLGAVALWPEGGKSLHIPRRYADIGRGVRTSTRSRTERLDRFVQGRFIHVQRNEEGSLRGPQRREGLVRGRRRSPDSGQNHRCIGTGTGDDACEDRTRRHQDSNNSALSGAGCRRWPRPGLGQFKFEGLPLLGHKVLRQDQARRVHD